MISSSEFYQFQLPPTSEEQENPPGQESYNEFLHQGFHGVNPRTYTKPDNHSWKEQTEYYGNTVLEELENRCMSITK